MNCDRGVDIRKLDTVGNGMLSVTVNISLALRDDTPTAEAFGYTAGNDGYKNYTAFTDLGSNDLFRSQQIFEMVSSLYVKFRKFDGKVYANDFYHLGTR